jgi:glycerol-3-phosphate dehydrogenase (NAD(P)+)
LVNLKSRLAVLGAGSWGTALAVRLSRNGHNVSLWGRDREAISAMAASRCNTRYLPEGILPETLTPTADLASAIAGIQGIVVAVPSEALRGILGQAALAGLPLTCPLLIATKGMERETALLPHEVGQECLPHHPLALLSGPSFAGEVIRELPTAVTLASRDTATAQFFATVLHDRVFRIYRGDDLVGVALGGAGKNVIAIGAGLSDGFGLGANARSALVTRGLAELMRLGTRLGAKTETFMGLSGVGDLILTATDDQSRNRRFGRLLAEGYSVEEAHKKIGQATEGVRTLVALEQRRRKSGVDMPITQALHAVLYQGADPLRTLAGLLERGRTDEFPVRGSLHAE